MFAIHFKFMTGKDKHIEEHHGDHVHTDCDHDVNCHAHDPGHQHAHGHGHHHHVHTVSGNIALAFALNLFFSIVEFIGGFLVNSIAIVSDAVHDLGDAMVIGISFFLERRSKKDPDLAHSYGYKRYSILGALITTCVLIAGAAIVIINAVPRLIEPEAANYDGMIIFAIFGLIVNGIAAWRTSGGNSLNQRAVSLHMLEDVLGWAAVLIGAVVMRFTGWAIIDPLMSIGIACFIGYNAIQNLSVALPIFLERTPKHIDLNALLDMLVEDIDGLGSIHHLHVWSLDEGTTVATLHAVVHPGYDLVLVKREIKAKLKENDIVHSTIEMEEIGEECDEDCPVCPCVHSAVGPHRH